MTWAVPTVAALVCRGRIRLLVFSAMTLVLKATVTDHAVIRGARSVVTSPAPARKLVDLEFAHATEKGEKCPACAPKERIVPDVVIPFFERDMCKLKVTAESLSRHDPDNNIDQVFLLWVSASPYWEYVVDLEAIVKAIEKKHKVHLIDFSSAMSGYKMKGWYAQQLLKLKIASLVHSEYYIVLDAKNTLIRDIKKDSFFTECNQAKIFAEYPVDEIPMPHIDWYKRAAKVLNVEMPRDVRWPASITPVVMHKPTVLKLLAYLGEGSGVNQLCHGPLCDLFGVTTTNGHGATEFTTYTMFAYAKTQRECHFSILNRTPDSPDHWGLSIWRSRPENREYMQWLNLGVVKNITLGLYRPIMFGAQPSALDGFPNDTRHEIVEYMAKLYSDANLYDPKNQSREQLIECVVGLYNYSGNMTGDGAL